MKIHISLNLAPVDIEMLCQQAINTLNEVATRREQDIRLSIEPGRSRIFPLDKDKVRQILYHLIFSVIQLSATGSVVRIHVSYKEEMIIMTVWVSHPWLGDGITELDPYFRLNSLPLLEMVTDLASYSSDSDRQEPDENLPTPIEQVENVNNFHSVTSVNHHSQNLTKTSGSLSRESLGLLLSCQLAELHGGQISIQGSQESGYRYVLSLPLQMPTSSPTSNT